jgi:hypothetical protein
MPFDDRNIAAFQDDSTVHAVFLSHNHGQTIMFGLYLHLGSGISAILGWLRRIMVPVPTRDRPAHIPAGGRTSWLKEGPTLVYTRFTRYETRQRISFV